MARTIDADALYDLVESRYKFSSGIEHSCERDFLDLICSMTTLTPPNEWVSVENAVPDPGERVLASDGIFVGEAYRTSANTWYRHTGFPWRDVLKSSVTLWMPLPAPHPGHPG